MKNKLILTLCFLSPISNYVWAQCAMCRAQLESMEDNSVAEGVNNGIVYLMLVPYVLLALVAYAIYRSFKKKKNKTK